MFEFSATFFFSFAPFVTRDIICPDAVIKLQMFTVYILSCIFRPVTFGGSSGILLEEIQDGTRAERSW
jgi:hypothetical protein